MYRYTVKCTFTTDDPELVDRWLAWLKDPHIADVIGAGASGAEVVRMNCDRPSFEIRYRFPTKRVFEKYIAEHALRLRDEGLRLFPLEAGLEYERTDGEVVFEKV